MPREKRRVACGAFVTNLTFAAIPHRPHHPQAFVNQENHSQAFVNQETILRLLLTKRMLTIQRLRSCLQSPPFSRRHKNQVIRVGF